MELRCRGRPPGIPEIRSGHPSTRLLRRGRSATCQHGDKTRHWSDGEAAGRGWAQPGNRRGPRSGSPERGTTMSVRPETIDVDAAHEYLTEGRAQFIDARPAREYDHAPEVIPGAVHIDAGTAVNIDEALRV